MADLTKQLLYNNILSLLIGILIAFFIAKNMNENIVIKKKYKSISRQSS